LWIALCPLSHVFKILLSNEDVTKPCKRLAAKLEIDHLCVGMFLTMHATLALAVTQSNTYNRFCDLIWSATKVSHHLQKAWYVETIYIVIYFNWNGWSMESILEVKLTSQQFPPNTCMHAYFLRNFQFLTS
jgi:hypothetical protein